MTCAKCGSEGGSGRFCLQCGAPLPSKNACSGCGAEISATAKFCVKCGTPQTAAAAPVPAMALCAGCGAKLDPAAKFCRACGKPRNAAAAPEPAAPLPAAAKPAVEVMSQVRERVAPPPQVREPVRQAPPPRLQVPAIATEPERQDTAPPGSNNVLVGVVAVVVLLLLVGLGWWLLGRKAQPSSAPVVVNGPAYQAPVAAKPSSGSLPALQPLSCSQESTLASPISNRATTIEFANTGQQAMALNWLDASGQRRAWGAPLQPGRSVLQKTYVGHNWLIADAQGNCIAIYQAEAAPGKATVGSTPN